MPTRRGRACPDESSPFLEKPETCWAKHGNYPAALPRPASLPTPSPRAVFLAAQPPAVSPCSRVSTLPTLPPPRSLEPGSETKVKLGQPHSSASGKLAHARPGQPVNHRRARPGQPASSDRSRIITAQYRLGAIPVKNATVAATATQHRLADRARIDPHPPRSPKGPFYGCIGATLTVSLPDWRQQSPALSTPRRHGQDFRKQQVTARPCSPPIHRPSDMSHPPARCSGLSHADHIRRSSHLDLLSNS